MIKHIINHFKKLFGTTDSAESVSAPVAVKTPVAPVVEKPKKAPKPKAKKSKK